MRDNLIYTLRSSPFSAPTRMLLSDLPKGAHAIVTGLEAAPGVDNVILRRLGELGFIAGESVQLLRRGPGGREPLAVLIGETMFALRALEAQCVQVSAAPAPAR